MRDADRIAGFAVVWVCRYNLFFGRFNACLFEVTLLDSDGTPRSQPQRRTIRRPGMVEAQNNEFEANDGEMPDSAQPAAGATVVIGNPDPCVNEQAAMVAFPKGCDRRRAHCDSDQFRHFFVVVVVVVAVGPGTLILKWMCI